MIITNLPKVIVIRPQVRPAFIAKINGQQFYAYRREDGEVVLTGRVLK